MPKGGVCGATGGRATGHDKYGKDGKGAKHSDGEG